MEIKQFSLNDKSVLILTMDENMSIDDATAVGKVYQKAFPDTTIIFNPFSSVKEITIVDRPNLIEADDNWLARAAMT